MRKVAGLITNFIVVAFIVYAIYGYATSSSKHARIITTIKRISPDTIILILNDKKIYSLDLRTPSYNARNFQLLFEGKEVWITHEKEGHYRISPTKQTDPPLLSVKEYIELIQLGFSDTDIAYSYSIPTEINNPNKDKKYGWGITTGAPGMSVKNISNIPKVEFDKYSPLVSAILTEYTGEQLFEAAYQAYVCSFIMTMANEPEKGQFLRWYSTKLMEEYSVETYGKSWNDVNFPGGLDASILVDEVVQKNNLSEELSAKKFLTEDPRCINLNLFTEMSLKMK